MNWAALLQVVLNVFEKNPALAESLLTGLLNMFVNNPALLTKAVAVGVAHLETNLPASPISLVSPIAV